MHLCIISIQLKQLFVPVLIRKGPKGKAEVVLLDHGLYEFVPNKVRQSLCRFWKAIVLNDQVNMKKHASDLGVEGNILLNFSYI